MCRSLAEFGKNGDTLVADIEDLEILDSSEKKCEHQKMSMFLIFPIGHGTAKLSGRDHGIRDCTLWREQRVTRNDFWSMEGDFIDHLTTSNHDLSSMCRKKKHSQIH